MTTTTQPNPPSMTDPTDAGGRGRLTISERTVGRIAAHAVTEVDGVGGVPTRVLGVAIGAEDLDNTAKVTAKVTGDAATLDVRLSVSYPASVAATTGNTRRHLTRRVEESTGLTVSRVDIIVSALLTGVTAGRRVR